MCKPEQLKYPKKLYHKKYYSFILKVTNDRKDGNYLVQKENAI